MSVPLLGAGVVRRAADVGRGVVRRARVAAAAARPPRAGAAQAGPRDLQLWVAASAILRRLVGGPPGLVHAGLGVRLKLRAAACAGRAGSEGIEGERSRQGIAGPRERRAAEGQEGYGRFGVSQERNYGMLGPSGGQLAAARLRTAQCTHLGSASRRARRRGPRWASRPRPAAPRAPPAAAAAPSPEARRR